MLINPSSPHSDDGWLERNIVDPSLKNERPIVLETKQLHVYYGDNEAIHEGDLKFPEHQISALIGPSGSGKSTYLRSLNRMNDGIARVSGEILYRESTSTAQKLTFTKCADGSAWSFNGLIPFLNQFMTTLPLPLSAAVSLIKKFWMKWWRPA